MSDTKNNQETTVKVNGPVINRTTYKGALSLLGEWQDPVAVGKQTHIQDAITTGGNIGMHFQTEDKKIWKCLETNIMGLHFSAPDRGLLKNPETGEPSKEGESKYTVDSTVPFGRKGGRQPQLSFA